MALFWATSNGALLVFILPSVPRAKAALPLLFFIFFFVFLLSAPIPTIASCPSTLPVAVSACRSLSLEAAFCNRSLPYTERTHDLISRLSLQEKAWQMVNMANGVERLGIPGYQWWQEALHGVANSPGVCFDHERGVPGATSFPQVILTGATFNPKLWRAIGEVVSTEARAMYNLGLAGLTYWSPNVNIFRDPRWGRGQETPGEDPLLTSKYAVNYVRGLQDVKGDSSGRLKIAACCKHYTSYDVDNWMGRDFRVTERFLFDAKVTQQDLEDTYQPPFEKCIRDGNVACVMCSYNKVNGVPMCLNRMLLRDIIRERWGLKGYICSDCDSIQVATEFMRYKTSPQAATAQSILAGLNVNCGNTLANYTEVAVKSYLLNETTVDESLTHVFTTLMRLGFFDGDVSDQPFGKLGANDICTPQHRKLALDAARQGIVLLKNSHNSLPLSTNHVKTLLLVGPNANATTAMIGNYAGTPCGFTTALEGLVKFTDVVFKEGCVGTFCEGRPDLIRNASAAAVNVDATVIVVGLDQGQEREGYDRLDLLLPGLQEKLVMDVAQASKGPVILIVMSGGPVDITFAKNNPKISSILWVGYPGGDGGQAIAEIIFGKYNPAGRLPMTWYPQSYIETLSMADMSMRPRLLKKQVISLGRTYRFYLGTPVFKFGEGLSYTNFNYSLPSQVGTLMVPVKSLPCRTSSSGSTKMGDLACTAVRINKLDCSEMTFNLSVKVGNDGNMDGHHVVLIYAHPQASHKGAPIKQLVAFDRVLVRQGKSKEVKLHINACEHLTTVDEYGHKVLALGAHKLTVGDNPNRYITLLHVNPM